MNKAIKVILVMALVASLTLNIAILGLVKNQSDRIDLITNRTNDIYNITMNAQNHSNEVETDQSEDIMSPAELAEYLKVDIKELYRLVIDNPDSEIPFLKFNGEVRFSKNAIDEYISSGVKILN